MAFVQESDWGLLRIFGRTVTFLLPPFVVFGSSCPKTLFNMVIFGTFNLPQYYILRRIPRTFDFYDDSSSMLTSLLSGYTVKNARILYILCH